MYRKSSIASISDSESEFDEEKNEQISEEVIALLEQAAEMNVKNGQKEGFNFDPENIDGGLETVYVQSEADYFVAMAYIGTCYTF